MSETQRQGLRTAWLWWAIPLAFLIVAFLFHWHWYVRLFGFIGVFTGIISHSETIRWLREYQGHLDTNEILQKDGGPRWKGNSQGEFFYSDLLCDAELGLGPTFVSIDTFRPKGEVPLRHFHEFLWQTHTDFDGFDLLCVLNDRTRPLLEGLARKKLVTWEVLQNPYSQDARITDIQKPSPPSSK